MNKHISWTLALSLTLSVQACSDDKSSSADPGDEQDANAAGSDAKSSTPDSGGEISICTDYCAKFGDCEPSEDCLKTCNSEAGLNPFEGVDGCADTLTALVDCWVAGATCETVATDQSCPTKYLAFVEKCVTPFCAANPKSALCGPSCKDLDCFGDSVCVEGELGPTCDCTDTGFEGETCDIPIDECETNPCMNGGTCYDGNADYSCGCVAGFTGKVCDQLCTDCAEAAKQGACAKQWSDCQAANGGESDFECYGCEDAFDACVSQDKECPGFSDYCDSDIPLVKQQMDFCFGEQCSGC